MIILGFPGIGKSTLAPKSLSIIDLESSNFMNDDGKRSDEWYIYYCKTGIDLSKQGYIVLMSIHDEVRRYFEANCGGENVWMVYPNMDLKDQWIKKLIKRYELSGRTAKDLKALNKIKTKYEKNIEDIRNTNLKKYEIKSMFYDLNGIIEFISLYSEEFNDANVH